MKNSTFLRRKVFHFYAKVPVKICTPIPEEYTPILEDRVGIDRFSGLNNSNLFLLIV